MTFTNDELLEALYRVPDFLTEDYTEEEIEEMKKDEYYTPEDLFSWDVFSYAAEDDGVDVVINDQSYKVKVAEDIGGMDEGSYAAIIFTVGDRYFRKEGYYQSHDGSYWDGDFSEVEPYEKKVAAYRVVRT